MGHPAAMPPVGFEQMSPEEQLEYAQELLTRATTAMQAAAVPQWHLDILQQRLAENDADPATAEDWSSVHSRLRDRYQRAE